MTAFGYHTAAMVPQVLLELKPSNGEIAQHQPGVGAWVHVRFGEWWPMWKTPPTKLRPDRGPEQA